jgi:DNA-binding IscR family transcriptional regulator
MPHEQCSIWLLHHPEGPIKLKEMDKRQLVSGQYREHLLIHLKTIGLVMSIRGAREGSPWQSRLPQ